jgi:hypothetical protein
MKMYILIGLFLCISFLSEAQPDNIKRIMEKQRPVPATAAFTNPGFPQMPGSE